MKQCVNCGAPVGRGAKGRCPSCYNYFRRHGHDVPADKQRRGHHHKQCVNCGMDIAGKRTARGGRCAACYDFHRRKGFDIPREQMHGKRAYPKSLLFCKDCKERLVTRYRKLQLCKRCYLWRKKHGQKVPAYRITRVCLNCQKPEIYSNGMCAACYNYQKRTGRDRPADLWRVGERGWCDCGNAATREIVVRIHNHNDRIPVCDDCHAEEMRQTALYGGNHDRKGTGRDSAAQS